MDIWGFICNFLFACDIFTSQLSAPVSLYALYILAANDYAAYLRKNKSHVVRTIKQRLLCSHYEVLSLLFVFFFCMCLCAYLHVCGYVCVCTGMFGGQRPTSILTHQVVYIPTYRAIVA